MQIPSSSQPKPVTDWWRPDLVELPRLTFVRRVVRVFLRGLAKFLVSVLLRATITGMENFPQKGPALVVLNHLGDADVVLLGASIPTTIDGMAKIELYEHWFVGPLFRMYGVIWIHRGRPDRKAIRAALDGLAEGRMIALAPEGRQTVEGGLEEGTDGASFLAMKSGVPIVPVAMTGTENENIYGNMKRWKRAQVTLSVGEPFFIREQADRQIMMREGTRQIMEALASLLPESYRGMYKETSSSQQRL
jgi:1-acyl-sn-glycerol-3-phosphate acyltransferase